MFQGVLELDLADYPNGRTYDAYQFWRYNQDQIAALPAGSYVRLRVGSCRPCMYPDMDWLRSDLMWQIIASNIYALEEWRQAMEGAPVVQEF